MSPQRALVGLDHVALLARSLERTVQFYRDLLGLEILNQPSDAAGATPDQVWLGVDQHPILTITAAPDATAGQLGIGAIHHLALAVPSPDTLLQWKRWLQDQEVLVSGPYDQQAYQDLVFTDPDGVLLELATLGPGFAVTRDGQEVYAPPKMSMAPYRNQEQIDAHTWRQPVTQITPAMALQGLHHVAIVTASLTRTDTFYREILGLPLVRKVIDSDDPEVERWYWGLDEGRPGTLVTAFPIVHAHGGGKPVPGRIGLGVPDHYALALEGVALSGWGTALDAAGIAVTSVRDDTDSLALTLQDPDGQAIELVAAASRLKADATANTQ